MPSLPVAYRCEFPPSVLVRYIQLYSFSLFSAVVFVTLVLKGLVDYRPTKCILVWGSDLLYRGCWKTKRLATLWLVMFMFISGYSSSVKNVCGRSLIPFCTWSLAVFTSSVMLHFLFEVHLSCATVPGHRALLVVMCPYTLHRPLCTNQTAFTSGRPITLISFFSGYSCVGTAEAFSAETTPEKWDTLIFQIFSKFRACILQPTFCLNCLSYLVFLAHFKIVLVVPPPPSWFPLSAMVAPEAAISPVFAIASYIPLAEYVYNLSPDG